MDRTTWHTARAWLAHPVTCVAVLLLLVNDHVLKAAQGTWWTGKLSDAAGLLVAPPLLAVAAACCGRAIRPRLLVGIPVLVVGAGFALVKSTATGAAVATAAWSLVAGTSLVRQDATDLLTLPALGLAALVGRRAAAAARRPEPRPARRRREPPRWVLVLPVAVLATVATSYAEPPSATSAKVVDGTAYVEGRDGWYRSLDGLTWTAAEDLTDGAAPESPGRAAQPPTEVFPDPWSEDVPSDDAPPRDGPGGDDRYGDDPAARDRATGGEPPVEEEDPAVARVACAPEGRTCFRPAGAGIGVERSDDGGRSWDPEWSVPAEDLRELRSRSGDVGALGTHDVAVLPVAGGYRVLAANGGDGLAVRDLGGTWTRLDHVYEDASAEPVPLPGERGPRPVYPVPEGVLAGLAATALTLLATGRSPARRGSGGATATAITGVCVAAAAALLAVVVRAETAAYAGRVGFPWFLAWVPPLLAGGAVLVAVAGAVTAAAVSGRARAITPAVLAGVAAGVAWETLPPRPIALVVGLAATALATWAARTWVQRARPPAPGPSWPWGPTPR